MGLKIKTIDREIETPTEKLKKKQIVQVEEMFEQLRDGTQKVT